MAELRERMIRVMELKNLSHNTQRVYLAAVTGIAKFYNLSPDKMTQEKIEDYLLYLKLDIFSGYTVRSYWQTYNKDLSAFFRETNYSPEVWMQIHNDWSFWGIKNKMYGFGFVHQSNGRADPISRSWNRVFATFIFEKGNLAFSIKPWYRIPEDDEDDDNSDITDYMGHGEIAAA